MRSHGVAGVSLRALARDVGVSHAAPSKHFRDKDSLLDALAMDGFNELADRTTRAAEAEDDTDSALRKVGMAFLRFSLEESDLLALMFTRKHAPDGSDDVVRSAQRAFAVPIGIFSAAKKTGEFDIEDVHQVALQLIATLQGIADLMSSGLVSTERGSDLVDASIDLLLRGLRRVP